MVQSEQWGEERSVCVVQGAFVVRGSDIMQVVIKVRDRGPGRVSEVQGARADDGMGDWRGG